MPEIVDNHDAHRFELVTDGQLSELTYRVDGDRLVLVHTGVPDELSGGGIGGLLVQAAVERARRDGLTIVPKCPYARHWIDEHPDEVHDVKVESVV
jgi:predicted GNAT family acetyltransferase